MKSKFLSRLAVAAVAAAVMGQGTYAISSIAPIDMDAARRAESPELDAGINAQELRVRNWMRELTLKTESEIPHCTGQLERTTWPRSTVY